MGAKEASDEPPCLVPRAGISGGPPMGRQDPPHDFDFFFSSSFSSRGCSAIRPPHGRVDVALLSDGAKRPEVLHRASFYVSIDFFGLRDSLRARFLSDSL